jgi:hypothetical protein
MIASAVYIGRHRRDVNCRHESLGPLQVGPDGELLLGFVDPSGSNLPYWLNQVSALLVQQMGVTLQSDSADDFVIHQSFNVRRPKE